MPTNNVTYPQLYIVGAGVDYSRFRQETDLKRSRKSEQASTVFGLMISGGSVSFGEGKTRLT